MTASKEEIADFKALLRSQTDFTIRVECYKWRVHSSVVSSQSECFSKVCKAPFKESTEKMVTLHEDCPWMIARMIGWFYRSEGEVTSHVAPVEEMMDQDIEAVYHKALKTTDQRRTIWQKWALFYRLADKYGIIELFQASREALKDCISQKPLLLPVLVEFTGLPVLHNDTELCESIIQSAVSSASCLQRLTNEIKTTCGSDRRIMELAYESALIESESRVQKCNARLDSAKKAQVILGDLITNFHNEIMYSNHGNFKKKLDAINIALVKALKETVKKGPIRNDECRFWPSPCWEPDAKTNWVFNGPSRNRVEGISHPGQNQRRIFWAMLSVR